jgi:uncharacterized membrane protein
LGEEARIDFLKKKLRPQVGVLHSKISNRPKNITHIYNKSITGVTVAGCWYLLSFNHCTRINHQLSPGSSCLETTKKAESFIVSYEKKQSLCIIVYPREEMADEVYHALRALEKQGEIDIKTAATLYHAEGNKLRLKHRQRLALWKDEFDVGSIGLILAGTRAENLAHAVIGTLMASHHTKHRCEARAFLDDKLGPDNSALVILVTNADWEAVQNEVDQFGGEELVVELTTTAVKRLAEIAADQDVAVAIQEFVEIEKVTL